MTTWSKTNIPARIALGIDGWVLVDAAGARIDWPALPSAEIARRELRAFKREQAGADADAASEAFGMRHMGPIDTD